jgi:LuxR family transcriptional regulator, regulator of acetate metabolism
MLAGTTVTRGVVVSNGTGCQLPLSALEGERLATLVASTLASVRLRWLSAEPLAAISEPDDRLDVLDEQLRASLSDGRHEHPRTVVRWLELVYEAGELREQLHERVLFEHLDVLARIQESVCELRNCKTPEELIEAAPGELCRSCGFSRALISRVQGSRWVPEAIEIGPGMDPEATRFAEHIEQLEIPLEHMLPETELVRRRMAALVTDPGADPLALSGVALRGRTQPYVAAPIMPTGRVIGFLHADRIGQEFPVTPEDRDHLWAFATQFGVLYERAVLMERIGAQREQLRQAFASAEAVDEVRHRAIELGRGGESAPAVPRAAAALFRSAESRLDGLMTRREREVIDLMASGATNIRIAEQLVISEGTVKSHVKHILRKLRAGNRAEAVARYLRILLREQEDRARP